MGLNGVGTKAVNALSSYFKVESFRDGKEKSVSFEFGEVVDDLPLTDSSKEKEQRCSLSQMTQSLKSLSIEMSMYQECLSIMFI